MQPAQSTGEKEEPPVTKTDTKQQVTFIKSTSTSEAERSNAKKVSEISSSDQGKNSRRASELSEDCAQFREPLLDF